MYKTQLDLTIDDTMTFENFISSMDKYMQYIDSLDDKVGNEALNLGLKSVLTAMVDLFGRFMNTAKTNLFKFPKDLKRSEIRAYVESHMVMIKRVEASSFHAFMDAEVDVPSRMSTSYLQSTTHLNDALSSLDMKGLSSHFITMVEDLIMSINGGKEYEKIFNQGNVKVKTMLAGVVKPYKLHRKDFSDKPGKRKAFSEVFANMQEVRDLKVALLDMEPNLMAVSKVRKDLDRLDTLTTKLFNVVKEDNDTSVSKLFIKSIASFLKAQATAYESFGELIGVQMALEHNYTEVMETLYGFDPKK